MSDEKIDIIIDVISKIIKVDPKLINETTSRENFSKWDSLEHLNLMLELEKKFSKKVSTSKMNDLTSVKKILQYFR